MIDKLAGLPTQIRQLEKRLKEMDASKVKPALVKEITDTIKNLKDMLKEKQDKKEQRAKAKAEKPQEVEAAPAASAPAMGAVAPNAVAPTQPGQPEASPTTPDSDKASCPLCGGVTFPDQAAYQQHMQFTHASDIMPTSPNQKLDKTVAAVDPVVNKVETDPKIAPGVIVPDSVKKHDEIVDKVEQDPKIAPHIVSDQEPQFKLDDTVMPARGSESKGKVMRWDGKPNDMVYVMWESGPLKERDGFGGYYPHDLKADKPVEAPVEAAMPKEEPVCQKCADMEAKHGDLKTNYEALLKDLQEERDIHYTQGNSSWVARLDQKIDDLKNAIAEKFGTEKTADGSSEDSETHTSIGGWIKPEELEDLQDIVENRLGWAVAGQFESIMQGAPLEEQNKNALRYIAEFLEKRKNEGAVETAAEIRTYLAKFPATEASVDKEAIGKVNFPSGACTECGYHTPGVLNHCTNCGKENPVKSPQPSPYKRPLNWHERQRPPIDRERWGTKEAAGGPELIRQINKATSGHGYDSTIYSLTNGRFQQNVPLKINETNVRMQQPENGLFEVKYPGMDWRPVLQPEFDQWLAQWKEINETNNQKEGSYGVNEEWHAGDKVQTPNGPGTIVGDVASFGSMTDPAFEVKLDNGAIYEYHYTTLRKLASDKMNKQADVCDSPDCGHSGEFHKEDKGGKSESCTKCKCRHRIETIWEAPRKHAGATNQKYIITDQGQSIELKPKSGVGESMIIPRYAAWTLNGSTADNVVESSDDLEALKQKYNVVEVIELGKPKPKQKQAGAENAKDLTIMDHTPPRANSGPDAGGKDSHDEFQDEWAMPAGIEMESAKGAPNSLFNYETAPAVAARLNSEINAPYKNATVATLGGRDYASVLLTVSADPKDQWPNGILHNSRYGTFHIDSSGEVEHYSGSFNRVNEPKMNFRKRNVKSIDQLIQVINQHVASVNAATQKQSSLNDSTPMKLNVLKRELLATPTKDGYDISHEGKKLFNIKGKEGKPMSQKQLEFCAQIEFTRGMKEAKLVEKIANLAPGSRVFIMAHDKTTRRVKFASLEHGYRGWAPASKFAYLIKEGQMMQHKDHIDNTFGTNGKEALVDCPNGSGNMVWLPMGELLPINQPPATPESLNDLESVKKIDNDPCTCTEETFPCDSCGRNLDRMHQEDLNKQARAPRPGEAHCKCGHPVDEHSGRLGGKCNETGCDCKKPVKTAKEKGFAKVVRPKSGDGWQCSECGKSFKSRNEFKKHDKTHKTAIIASARNPINWNGKDYFGILADLDGNIISGYTYEQGEEAGWDLYFTPEEDVAWGHGELVYIYGSQLTTQWGATYGHGGLQGVPEAEREAKEPEILAKVKSQVAVKPTDPKSVKSDMNFPPIYFARPEAKERAEMFGLIDVEDGDLTPEGLAAKQREMTEGHDIEATGPEYKLTPDMICDQCEQALAIPGKGKCKSCWKEFESLHRDASRPTWRACKSCGKDFMTSNYKDYCSDECYAKAGSPKETPVEPWPTFDESPRRGRYASQKQALRQALPPQILNRRNEVNADENTPCSHCGQEADPRDMQSDNKGNKFCSPGCYTASKTWPVWRPRMAKKATSNSYIHGKLLKEFEAKYPQYNGWTFDYMYPGNYRYYKDGLNDVFFTPDFNEDGEVDIQVSTPDLAEVVDGDSIVYQSPLTADALFAIVKPWLDKQEGSVKQADSEDFDSESGTGIEPGDLVDFGAYGQLYVVSLNGRSSRVTDLKEERFNPSAPGWYYNVIGNEPILEKGSDARDPEDALDSEGSRNCKQCGAEFTPNHPNEMYCSKNCWKDSGARIVSSLNKYARVVHRDDGWHVLSEKGKNLGGPYKSKAQAVKRLRQVEYFKHHGAIRPFGKTVLAEAMIDPYESLTNHITDMRSRMTQVQDKIQAVPAVKTAGEDNSKLDLPSLFEDITHGVALLEDKLGGDTKADPNVHAMVEELENKLWKLEEECGITPKLSEHEKAEPEHKEIVEDIEKEAGSTHTKCIKCHGPLGMNEDTVCSECWGKEHWDSLKKKKAGFDAFITPGSSRTRCWYCKKTVSDLGSVEAFKKHVRTHPQARKDYDKHASLRKRAMQPSKEDYIGYLKETFIPDLEESGNDATADDLKEIVMHLEDGTVDEQLVQWLLTTLIPDLVDSGKNFTAEDFLEGIYWMTGKQHPMPKSDNYDSEGFAKNPDVMGPESSLKNADQVTDETIVTNDPNAVIDPTNPLSPEQAAAIPSAQNVQPTDDDNLEVSVVAPTSPPPPGQKWVFDTQFNKYVLMPDPASANRTI